MGDIEIEVTKPVEEKPKKKGSDIRKKLKERSGKAAKDFRTFAFKGNIIDLAVAVIIGAAFGKIISSLVSDLIMPCIGMLIGDVDFSQFRIVLKPGNGADIPETAFRYGAFIQVVFEFFIIALSIYIVFKVIARVKKLAERKQENTPPPPPPPPTKTEQLLTDIKKILEDKK